MATVVAANNDPSPQIRKPRRMNSNTGAAKRPPQARRVAGLGRLSLSTAVIGAFALAAVPDTASACACGCGIFDIGANNAFPTMSDSGFSAWLRYSFMNQNKNWEGSSSAPASDNADKQIKTSFYTFGGQYMINHAWGVMVELPIFERSFTTTGDGGPYPLGQEATTKLTALGDAVIQGVYAGFSPDMSTGVTFGVKLPTGDYTGPYIPPNAAAGTTGGMAYDRDTLPGTGSTDIVLGGYNVGNLNADGSLDYFLQARYQFAVFTRDGATTNAAQTGASYRPGNEINLGAGITYSLGAVGGFSKVAPVLQLVASKRNADGGPTASLNSGYRRFLVAPGIDLRAGNYKIFANVSVPISQNVNTDVPSSGNVGQLVASTLWTLQLGYDF